MGICASRTSKVADVKKVRASKLGTRKSGKYSSINSSVMGIDERHLKEGEGDANIVAALRAKRRGIMGNAMVEIEDDFEVTEYPKTHEEKKHIHAAVRENVLFADLERIALYDLIRAMQPMQVDEGQVIIRQGDEGDYFYVVESGKFDILVNDERVTVFGEGTSNFCFGELALLYNCPRAATVKAQTKGKVWKIDRHTFRNVVAQQSHSKHTKLQSVLRKGVLNNLEDEQLDLIANAATVVTFRQGDQIIKKGEPGEVFYIIEEGQVVCKNLPGNQNNNVLKEGDYFGERALLKKEPRVADIFANSTKVKLIALHREDFEKLLGGISDLLEQNLGTRLLLCVPILASLSDEQRSKLFSKLRLVKYEPEKVIADNSVNTFHIIKEGSVEVRVVDENNKEAVEVLATGQYFGQKQLKSPGHNKFKAKALTQCECFQLDKETYLQVLDPIEEKMRNSGSSPSPNRRESQNGFAAEEPKDVRNAIPFKHLELRNTLGTGTFGRVKLAVHKKTGKAYALKMLQKSQIVALRQEKNIMNEKMVLQMVNHPFILKLYSTYKDKHRLYMLLELVQGGELFSRLQNNDTPGRVPVRDARFYAACVVDALAHLHSQYIVYRDLKPENLLIDRDGYIKIVDFGFAKIVKNRTYTLCGTPEYLAPELVLGKGHGRGVDCWAVGVLLYEMVAGYSPFADHENGDQMVICRHILKGKVTFPPYLKDEDLQDLVRNLLQKDITKRLGCLKDGMNDIRNHKFFKKINWSKLRQRKEKAPWKPDIGDPYDTNNFDTYDEGDDLVPYRDDGRNWDADF